MVEEETSQRLTAGPGEGPERGRDPGPCECFFGSLPDRGDFGGEMESNLGHQRRCCDRRIAAYENGRVQEGQAKWPPTIPPSISQPTHPFERNLVRQSAGSSFAT